VAVLSGKGVVVGVSSRITIGVVEDSGVGVSVYVGTGVAVGVSGERVVSWKRD
jgi:hypothetical protein